MSKKAISVTLEGDNLLWLKGHVEASGLRSVSELLDRLVREVRRTQAGPVRSVVGTIDIAADDPNLEHADAAVRELFDRSLGRLLVAKEATRPYDRSPRPRRRRRG